MPGGYSAQPGMPPDIISTRAAVAIYALFRQRVPHQTGLLDLVAQCMDKAGGFDAVLPGTKDATTSTRSLFATWAGVNTLQMLSDPSADAGSWIERIWGVGNRFVLPVSRIGH